MMTDALLQLTSAQTVTTTAVTLSSIDLSEARDIAIGADLYLAFTVDVDPAPTTATVTFQVITATDTALTAGVTVIASTAAILVSDLVIHQPAGLTTAQGGARKPIIVCISPSQLTTQPLGQRYLGGQFVVASGPLTLGKFSATLVDTDMTTNVYYRSGLVVY